MKTNCFRKIITIVICCCTLYVQAQSGSAYINDLEHLYRHLQKTPGFKAQIKGKQRNSYHSLFTGLRQEQPSDDLQHFWLLSQLLLPIRDNHLGFYQLPVTYLPVKAFADSAAVNHYRSSASFQNFPKAALRLDSLEAALASTPADSITGIYQYGSYLTAGVFRTQKPDSLVGVVLQANMPNWMPGQVAFMLREYAPQRFHAWYAHPVHKNFMLKRNERWMDGSFANSSFYGSLTWEVWRKVAAHPDFVNLWPDVPVFRMEKKPGYTYLRLGSFDASTNGLNKSQAFFDSIKDSLQGSNLILDLRNNSGGSFKASRKYLKLVKRFARSGKVYALANFHTVSNGEQFLLRLRRNKNVQVLGIPTQGMLAYGSNYGKRITLPSGKAGFYPTDMRDWFRCVRYEDKGIVPDRALRPDRDWIEQVLAIIAGN